MLKVCCIDIVEIVCYAIAMFVWLVQSSEIIVQLLKFRFTLLFLNAWINGTHMIQI